MEEYLGNIIYEFYKLNHAGNLRINITSSSLVKTYLVSWEIMGVIGNSNQRRLHGGISYNLYLI